LVGSLVVRESRLGDLRPGWQSSADAGLPDLPPLGATQLSAERFAAIDSFLHAALDLNVRTYMAEAIWHRVRPQLTMPSDVTLSTKRLLEALAYERRAMSRYK
jgi:hypothetical protein